MSNLSVSTKFGQNLQVPAGSAAIAQNDFIEIGGPGNEAYSVTTMDYAIPSAGVQYNTESTVGSKASPGYMRQQVQRDQAGNFYILGMNSSGQLTVTKFSPQGFGLPGTILDVSTSNVYSARLLRLSNGTFAAVYARASGALYFVIFDSSLNLVTPAPVAVANEYFTGSNVVYHDATAFAAGGFGIVYQLAITGTQVLLQTYANNGAGILTASNIQTLSGTLAQVWLRTVQLPNGNLLVVMRGTMTPVGTSFVIINTSGVNQVSNTVADSGSSLGLIGVDFLPSGIFAIAEADGVNLGCAVYNQSGILQGAPLSSSDTVNSVTSAQMKLCNDGSKFWLVYLGSSGNGINIVQIPITGTNYISTLGLNSATISSNNFSLDADVINGLLTVFAASTLTGGQYWMTFGLPDPSIGAAVPYIRTPPLSFGTAAATTGSWWPRLFNAGDWVGIFVYDRQNVQGQYFSIQRLERGAIIGISQSQIAAGNAGALATVNPGPGTYPCGNASLPAGLIGTSGLQYNQGSSPPFGNIGTLFANGATMQGIAFTPGPFVALNSYPLTGKFGTGQWVTFSTPGTYSFTASTNLIRVRVNGSGQSGGPTPGDGGTASFGSLISATGGTSGGPGTGFGGQFQATGGTPGTGSGHNGGGGGGAGSLLGNGGHGGNSGTGAGGGGGGVGANAGANGSTVGGGGGAGTLTGASGYVAGAASDGTKAFGNGILPTGTFVTRFPFDVFGGSGGYGAPNKGVDLGGYDGAIGGGGGGGWSTTANAPGGNGGDGGGGGGGAGIASTGNGGAGGLGAGGGGSGSAGGYGGGFAAGVFPTSPGTVYTVTVPAGGVPGGAGGPGGNGAVTIEW